MKTCTNCGAQITCGCQERTASNGKQVCSNCITAYENSLQTITNEKPLSQ
jgi:hypothetical protein